MSRRHQQQPGPELSGFQTNIMHKQGYCIPCIPCCVQELWRDALQAAADEPAAEDSIQLQLKGAARPSSAAHAGQDSAPAMPHPSTAAAAAEDAGPAASERRRARSIVGLLTASTQQVASRPSRRSNAASQPRSSLLESAAAAAPGASVSDADVDADTEQEESLPGQQQQQHQDRGQVLVPPAEQVQPERRRSSTSRSAVRGTAAGRPSKLLQAPLQQPARLSQRQGVLLMQQLARRSGSELHAALPRASLLQQQQPGRVSAGPQSRGTTPGRRTSLLQGMPERVSVSLTEGLPQKVRSHSLQQPGGRLSLLRQQPGRASQVQKHARAAARDSHITGGAHGEPDLSGLLPQKVTQLQFMAARLSQAGAQAIPDRVSGVGGTNSSRGYGGSNTGAGMGSKRTSLTAAAAAANQHHREKSRGRHQEGDAIHSSDCSDSDTASGSKGAGDSSSSSDGGSGSNTGSSDASESSASDSGSSDGSSGSSGTSPGKQRHVRAAPHTW